MIIRLQSAPRMTIVTLRIGQASASLAPVAIAQTVTNPYALVPAQAFGLSLNFNPINVLTTAVMS